MSALRNGWLGFQLAILILISAFAISAPPARAQNADLDKAIELLANDSFSDTIAAIDLITQSGVPQAASIIEALGDRRLLFDNASKTVFYRDATGAIRDARTDAIASSAPADLSTVRLNNRVRSAAQAAMGGLSILNPDPSRRAEAAAAVLKARDASALPALEAALAKETVPNIKATMELARAAILVNKTDAPIEARMSAIETLASKGNRDSLAILKSLPANSPEPMRKTADAAIADIEQRLAMWGIAQNLWYGVSLGSVLLLAAIGLAITFGVMGVINMAHGEMVMLGAYTTFVVQEIIRTSAPGLFDYSLGIAIPLAFLVAGGVGVAMERGVIRFLYGRPLETLLATWGISLILQQAVRTAFGPTNREVGTPQFMSGAFQVGEMAITWNRLYIVIFAAVIFTGLLMTLRYTALGLQMRAVTQNRRMAASMGIPTDRVDALTFGLGSGIAGLAGVALSQIDNVSPNLGQSYIIDSFLVVVFGGVGNLWGTLVGALSLGVANKLLEPYAGAVLGKILLLVAIILFTQKRPRGLFALKGRAIEA